jgi:molybdopterin biosynthesis enzyme MoaB
VLSRAIAGLRAKAIILNLPGSPRGAVESFDAVQGVLAHAVAVVGGARHD